MFNLRCKVIGGWCEPDVNVAFRSEVDLAAQHSLPPITPGQLTHLTVLQVTVTLLDLGMAIVQRNVPHNLKDLQRLNDLNSRILHQHNQRCKHS